MTADTDLRVVWHPQVRAGQPTIGDRRLTCTDVAGCVAAGMSVPVVASYYEITPEQVRLACWWIVVHDRERTAWKVRARKQWADWAHEWSGWAWRRTPQGKHPGNPPRLTT